MSDKTASKLFEDAFNKYIKKNLELWQQEPAKKILDDGFVPRKKGASPFFVNKLSKDYWVNYLSSSDDTNAKFQVNAWRMLDSFICDHLSGELPADVFWHYSISVIKSWYEAVNNNPSLSHIWFDMAAGLRSSKVAFYLSIVDEAIANKYINGRDRALLDRVARIHIDRFITDRNLQGNNGSNHDLFVLQGRVELYLAYADQLGSRAREIDKKVHDFFYNQFNGTYSHSENSPAYHVYVTNKLYHHINSSKSNELIELFSGAKEVERFLVFPKRLIQFGDTDGGPIGNNIKYCNDLSDSKVGKFHGKHIVLDPNEHGDGYFVARRVIDNGSDSASMLAVNGKNVNKVHKHFDFLSFELMERGEFVFTDSGKYSYDNDNFSQSFRLPSAHNCVARENEYLESLYQVKGHPLIHGYSYSEKGGFEVKGEYTVNNYSVKRVILWKPENSFSIKDSVRVDPSSLDGGDLGIIDTFCHYLQISKDLECRIENNQVMLYQKKSKELFGMIEVDVICAQSGSCKKYSVELINGQKSDPAIGWYSVKYGSAEPRDVIKTKFDISSNGVESSANVNIKFSMA